ncbi:MAG TPA: hypothetical protein VF316_13415 [Polyangiaceae bacterium]
MGSRMNRSQFRVPSTTMPRLLAVKRVGAILFFPLCSIMVSTVASAEPRSDLAPAAAPRAPAVSETTAADATSLSGAVLFATAYILSIAVSLRADTSCQGAQCNERYLSLVPVFGGVLQFALTSKAFHELHHGDDCYPLTVAAVTGQAIGVAAVVTGLVMRYISHRRAGAGEPHVTGGPFDGGGAGVSLSVQFF